MVEVRALSVGQRVLYSIPHPPPSKPTFSSVLHFSPISLLFHSSSQRIPPTPTTTTTARTSPKPSLPLWLLCASAVIEHDGVLVIPYLSLTYQLLILPSYSRDPPGSAFQGYHPSSSSDIVLATMLRAPVLVGILFLSLSPSFSYIMIGLEKPPLFRP